MANRHPRKQHTGTRVATIRRWLVDADHRRPTVVYKLRFAERRKKSFGVDEEGGSTKRTLTRERSASRTEKAEEKVWKLKRRNYFWATALAPWVKRQVCESSLVDRCCFTEDKPRRFTGISETMKRYSSAPCLADENADGKRTKSVEEPDTREYLQLALARVLELQREIKEGTYTTDHTSDLGESSSEEDLTQEVLRKVFKNLPGTPESVGNIIDRASKSKNSRVDAIRGKRIQLLGYDTCRRAAVEFMTNSVRETRQDARPKVVQSNRSVFRVGIYSRNEPRVAYRRTGLLKGPSSYDQEIRERMLRSLDLHLASKQRDYTAKLMRSGI